MKRFGLDWALAIIAFGGVAFMSLGRFDATPMPSALALLPFPADKVMHVVLYFVLFLSLVPLVVCRTQRHARWFCAILGVAVAFGGLMELAQGMTAYRSCDLWDAVANAIGASCAWLLASLIERTRRV